MKLNYFYLVAKDHTNEYTTLELFVRKSTKKKIVPVEEIIRKNMLVELTIKFEKDGKEEDIRIMSFNTESLMNWVKENYPDLYELIPSFDFDKFDFIANEMVCSSSLSYTEAPKEHLEDLEHQFGSTPEAEDFIPERDTVEASIAEIAAKGFYTEIHCYPDTPVGFWNYYGTDFQSLLDHVVKD
jgi:hypothetical protein